MYFNTSSSLVSSSSSKLLYHLLHIQDQLLLQRQIEEIHFSPINYHLIYQTIGFHTLSIMLDGVVWGGHVWELKLVHNHFSSGRLSMMELKPTVGIESKSFVRSIQHELWPLDEIDPKKAKLPCCLVWTPLPVVSWLAPFIGHVGICREDGAVIDFSGSNLINVDNFAYGAIARYIQLDREKCCFPPNLTGHTCKHRYIHTEYGSAMTWDDAIQSSVCHFEHKCYNLFTCNCHSFVANCLNRLCYNESMSWNMINVAALVLIKGQWVDKFSIVRSFLPFILVLCLAITVVGWPFLIGLLSFSMLLISWFVLGTYYVKSLFEY